MKRTVIDKIISQRRHVIIMQLAVLVVILAGIFGAIFIEPKQTATVHESVDLQTVTPKPQASAVIPEKISSVQVRGKAAFVYDVKAKRVLYAKNENQALPLASITKLMTALLAHELIAENADATVSMRAVQQEGSSGLEPGEHLTIKELNQLALVSSSNDAAYALGANAGELLGDKDPTAQFVQGMNIRAKELQLDSLTYKNTTGLDISPTEAGAFGSAKDISLLMEYILKNYPDIIAPTQKSSGRVYNDNGEYHDMENTNEILYAIPNLLGSKTGYTDLAGGNLIVAFDAGLDRPIIVTVLGSTRDERFSDVLRLVTAVRENITNI